MKNQPLLSICIPTFNRPEILKAVLDSIFTQNVDETLYEVCVSDNSKTADNKNIIDSYFKDKTNLKYKQTDCEGFYNSIEALKLGTGRFLKLNNDTGKFIDRALERMIKSLNDISVSDNSVIFYTMTSSMEQPQISASSSFDDFLFSISHVSTWSSSFGIWKKDLDDLLEKDIAINRMFPHTSLLFYLYDKQKYYIDSYKYIDTVEVSKKGGYNLPDVFGIQYMSLVNALLNNNYITQKTYQKISSDTENFIVEWYINQLCNPEKFCFDFSHKGKSIYKAFGLNGFFRFYFNVLKCRLGKRV